MARQKGIIKLKGTIGDISFYKSRDGYLAREKGGIEAERIANDPAFQRTRENGMEFGRAGSAGKLLRTALRGMLQATADKRMVGRLTKAMIKVIQADATSVRGMRNVIDGEAELLQGFEFNIAGKLGTTLFAPYSFDLQRVIGQFGVSIPPFIPVNMIGAPAGATHFKIMTAVALVDFTGETFEASTLNSAVLPINSVLTAEFNAEYNLTAESTFPFFFALGIEFYQAVNGVNYLLKNGAFNAASLARVDGGV